METIEDLRINWTSLYHDQLPALAKARDPVQKHWPVHLDHCFARIILDNAVGIDRPWTEVVKAPAVKNMSASQLNAAIRLAQDLAIGEADLGALNERSLQLRGKKRKADGLENESLTPEKEGRTAKKRKQEDTPTISSYFLPSPASPLKEESTGTHLKPTQNNELPTENQEDTLQAPHDLATELDRIAASNLTLFRKQMLRLLCQIPPGRYSTYQAMSDYITKTSHKTCARAVGNAMRNNPFAPEVPCHRVLAADGTLGGFGGHWGELGKFANKKHELLHAEGVRFDSRGKVKGPVFRDFHT